MDMKNILSSWLKAIACFAFALALMFFPPSASHAASTMHDGHHAVSVSAEHSPAMHAQGEQASLADHGQCGTPSVEAEDEQAAGKCCNGICLSVYLPETAVTLAEQPSTSKHLMPSEQTRSVAAPGFLRPPQILI